MPKGASVLIVDDDSELTHILAAYLERAGHECVKVHTGAQALAEWQKRSFDLVISDLNMPHGDGIDLAESLRRSEAVPIIFITGFKGDFEDRLSSTENVTVLEKPFDLKLLLGIIDATLAGVAVGDDGVRVPHSPDPPR